MKLSPYPVVPERAAHKSRRPSPRTASAGERMSRRSIARPGDETYLGYDRNFVKWIPLVVPIFAVLLALGTYFIVGTVV